MVSWNGLFWWKSFYVKYHLKMTINVTKPEFLIERFKFDCICERAQRIFLSIQISLYLQPTDGVIKRDYLEYSFQKCLKRKEICFIVNWFWWRDFRFSQSEECFRISQEKIPEILSRLAISDDWYKMWKEKVQIATSCTNDEK